MLRLLVIAVMAVSATAQAQALTAAVADAQRLDDAQVKKVQRACEAVLGQLAALAVGEGPAWVKGAPRRCEDDCAADLVKSLSAPAVAVLSLKGDRGDRFTFTVSFWLEGEKKGEKAGAGELSDAQAALKPAVEALLPAWARKGWGGLRVQVQPGAVVKVDGRVSDVAPGEVVPVPAGPHRVDVVFPDGSAVLQRVELPEGARGRLEVQPPGPAVTGGAQRLGTSGVRLASYATFMVGAAAIAGGLVAGALSRGTSVGMAPCRPDSRDCATLDAAQAAHAQAQAYATTGNVMLGVGTGLVVTGAGLFLFDTLGSR